MLIVHDDYSWFCYQFKVDIIFIMHKLQYVISMIMKKIVTILIVLQVHFLTKWEAHWSWTASEVAHYDMIH